MIFDADFYRLAARMQQEIDIISSKLNDLSRMYYRLLEDETAAEKEQEAKEGDDRK